MIFLSSENPTHMHSTKKALINAINSLSFFFFNMPSRFYNKPSIIKQQKKMRLRNGFAGQHLSSLSLTTIVLTACPLLRKSAPSWPPVPCFHPASGPDTQESLLFLACVPLRGWRWPCSWQNVQQF